MRTEKDSMGAMLLPDEALWGASTQRAVQNFPISALRFPRIFLKSIGLIKRSAARANLALSLLDEKRAAAIVKACDEVIAGNHDAHFVVDIFQTGSGTSTNMNANEVVANRAIEIMGGGRGDKSLLHPNDHVNMSQSSNDVIPTTIHLAAHEAIDEALLPALNQLAAALEQKAASFATVIKAGRTHLQDATPITLGQEFGGYAAQVRMAIERLVARRGALLELALGGTAVGTGLNTHPQFAAKAIDEINGFLGKSYKYFEARNHFVLQSTQEPAVEISGILRTIACALLKIANDIRWLSSGPRCSIFELQLPEVQPGSSIMPAKVNPVICESVMMVCTHVLGNDAAIAISAQHGNFELNTMLPVIAHNLLEAIELLSNAAKNFAVNCVSGIEANVEQCKRYAELSLATCTSLAPKIGYDLAAKVAKTAYSEGKTVRQTAKEMGVLKDEELEVALDLMAMTKPGL